jgi:cation:H+ antiporter
MLDYVWLVVGFALLIKAADLLVEGASTLARHFRVSNLVIGLTVVAFGTSLPEMVVSLMATINGNADLAIGNILGSNIANINLILGVSALFFCLTVEESTILSEIPFSLTATLLFGFLANASLFMATKELSISRLDGIILLIFFLVFMAYIWKMARQDELLAAELPVDKRFSTSLTVFFILLGCGGLYLGGKLVVQSAVSLALLWGLSESFIGLTIVAVGTSLPELVTSVTAAIRRNAGIAVGNVVGSNIFNILWILGISAVIRSLPFDLINNTDIVMVVFSSTLLLFAMAIGPKRCINRVKGLIFIGIYIAYVIYLVRRG